MYTIGRYDLYSNGEYTLDTTFTTDTPYWRVEEGQLYYIHWDVIRTVYVERAKTKVCMTEQEARENNCGCYYKILSA